MNFKLSNFKTKRKLLLPFITLLVSLYFSLIFTFGMLVGYLSTHLFDKKLTKKGRIKMVRFNLGKVRVHLHHWILGILGLILFHLTVSLSLLPTVCLGMAGGLIFHDIHLDSNWWRVVSRKKTGR